MTALPEASNVTSGGVTLAARRQGRGPGRLLCIHGVGSYMESWDGVAASIGDAFTVATFDMRGHGRSERVRGRYEIDDLAADAIAIADAAGWDRFDLAGFSLGGLVAQRLALTHPARVRRLVLLSTVAGRDEDERARVAERLAALRRTDPGTHHEASLSRWIGEDFQARNPEVIAELRRRDADNDRDCYAAAYRVLAETDLADALPAIRCPTLIATGEEDLGSTPRMARLMHARIVESQLRILPGLRHSILIEAPATVAAVMRDFLLSEIDHG